MKRRRITLMRHGDVEYVGADGERVDDRMVSLTERGQHQARAAAALLADVPFDLVVTSGLLRTEQTADLVLEGRDVPRRERVEALQEIRPGTFEDVETEEEMRATVVDAFWQAGAATEESRFMTGDAYLAFHTRVRDALAPILSDASWSEALFVLHGGVNRVVLGDALGAGRAAWGAIEQEACCINVLDLLPAAPSDAYGGRLPGTSARTVIRLMNHTPYAADKGRARHTSLEALWKRFTGEA